MSVSCEVERYAHVRYNPLEQVSEAGRMSEPRRWICPCFLCCHLCALTLCHLDSPSLAPLKPFPRSPESAALVFPSSSAWHSYLLPPPPWKLLVFPDILIFSPYHIGSFLPILFFCFLPFLPTSGNCRGPKLSARPSLYLGNAMQLGTISLVSISTALIFIPLDYNLLLSSTLWFTLGHGISSSV